ncbi:hypothetical protein [Streptomyces microflavus]|uniref:hypothetical protein n=1 Tax=Streptomyces microflavus TaxID=1919 RepID=UPI00382B137F
MEGGEESGGGLDGERGRGAVAQEGGGVGVLARGGTGVGEDQAVVGDDQVLDLDALDMDTQAQGRRGISCARAAYEASRDRAVTAAQDALEQSGLGPGDVDVLITSYPGR